MNDATLAAFRQIAENLTNPNKMPKDWEWQGQWMSQRMVEITEQRAKEMAARYGGVAKKMENLH
jgi:hypothetical protein